jgi:hypothetical protein
MPSSRTRTRAIHAVLLSAAAVLLALHFIHLQADFPNNSPWMDWSKYTDEGWYGDAAIRHVSLGHWFVPGDFNPAAALPVWPLLEAFVFTLTGVSLAAVRALTVTVFAGILLAAWFLLARRDGRPKSSLTASIAVLLLAANPFCFVFTRIAILEPLLILLSLLALLAASSAVPPPPALLRTRLLPIFAIGLLLPAMVLTKTTALFLMPAVFWMLFARTRYRIPAYLRVALPAAALAICLWLVYFLAIVRPHFLLDYRYLFSANAYTGMDQDNFVAVLADTLKDGRWMGHLLYPLAFAAALIAVATAIAQPRRIARHPLIVSLVLWSAGYAAFLAYHNNLQPRYYLVVAVPLTLLLPVVVEDLLLPRLTSAPARTLALAASAIGLLAIVLPDIRQTLHFVRHPEYTFVRAAAGIAATIRYDQSQDPTHNPLILSISGSDLSLMTGLPSICDDFGTIDLIDRVKLYTPGWYVAWNQVEDDKLDAIWPLYALQRVASFPAMDDPDRNLLILYKIVPATSPGQRPNRQHKPTPRPLRTKVGQQPSTTQLVH